MLQKLQLRQIELKIVTDKNDILEDSLFSSFPKFFAVVFQILFRTPCNDLYLKLLEN